MRVLGRGIGRGRGTSGSGFGLGLGVGCGGCAHARPPPHPAPAPDPEPRPSPGPRPGPKARIPRPAPIPSPRMTTAARTRAIPFFNYKGAFTADEEAYVQIFRDIIHRGAFIQQKDLIDFEKRLAEYLGVKHAIGVGNATDGLIMAWRAAGLK